MPPSTAALTVATIARVAAEVRLQLAPRLGVLAAVPFAALQDAVTISTPLGPLATRARPHFGLPPTTWAMSEADPVEEEAWIWLNAEAWPELVADVPRTRATIAHELGHLALQADELADLEVDAEPEHDAHLDQEAWTFAAHLLVPDQALRRLTRAKAQDLATRFGVTTMLAAKRLEEFSRTA